MYGVYESTHNLNPREVKIVTSIDGIRGYKDTPCYFVGEWYKLDDASKIREYTETHNISTPEEPTNQSNKDKSL